MWFARRDDATPRRGLGASALAVAAIVALPVAMAGGTGAAARTPAGGARATPAADAPPGPTTLTSTGAEQDYTVPSGVVLLTVEATGAGGGGGSGLGGSGFGLTAQLPVTPGQVLYAEVGQPGTSGGGAGFGGGGGAGTTSTGPTNADAGSGGGATDVRTCSELAISCPGGGTSADSRLIVAGGGGGGGGQGSSVGDVCGVSQSGGNAGAGNGSGGTVVTTSTGTVITGSPDATTAPSTPAGGGSSTGPGTGGPSADNCAGAGSSDADSAAGASGTGTVGGAGGTGPAGTGGGGGGGGGYFAGGGGASGPEGCIVNTCTTAFNGEGGGGGSSFVIASATLETGSYGTTSSAPSVTFTPQIEIDSPADGSTVPAGQVVNAGWSCDTSQVSGCAGTVAPGQPVDTSQCGVNTFVVTGSIMGQSVTGTVNYTVAMNVTTASLPDATVGVAYREQLQATCGTTPYKWRRTSGTLPHGMKLKTTGMIMGSPYKKDALGTYTFAVLVRDSHMPHDFATEIYTLTLDPQ
jgi:hypothetical protein